MLEHKTGFDTQIRRKIVRDGHTLDLVAKTLNGRQQELKNVVAALRVPHIEAATRAVREPIKIRLGIGNALLIDLDAVCFAEFVGVKASFEFHHADTNIFVEQQLDGTFGGFIACAVRIEIQMQVLRVAFSARICSVVRAVPHGATTSATPACVAPITSI